MAWVKLKLAVGICVTVACAGLLATVAISQSEAPPHLAAGVPLTPGPAALIVVGLNTSDAPEQIQEIAGQIRRALVQRGFDESHVEILSGKVTREQILQKLHDLAGSVREEFWLVLLGQSGKAQGGVPAFQVSGPRLTALDLKSSLEAIPGRQFVFIGTGSSGGFLPSLLDERRTLLSATRAEGEPDQPRFLSAWAKAFAADSKAPFATLAARASADVSDQYTKANMAQSEHAQLAEAATGKILDAPFGAAIVVSTNQPVLEK